MSASSLSDRLTKYGQAYVKLKAHHMNVMWMSHDAQNMLTLCCCPTLVRSSTSQADWSPADWMLACVDRRLCKE